MNPNAIEAKILTGNRGRGVDVLIPRIPLIPTDMSLEYKRVQFTVEVTLACAKHRKFGTKIGLNPHKKKTVSVTL